MSVGYINLVRYAVRQAQREAKPFSFSVLYFPIGKVSYHETI